MLIVIYNTLSMHWSTITINMHVHINCILFTLCFYLEVSNLCTFNMSYNNKSIEINLLKPNSSSEERLLIVLVST